MTEKLKYFVNGENLTDQAFLFEWAKLGAEAHCHLRDRAWTLECLERARDRLTDIVQGFVERK